MTDRITRRRLLILGGVSAAAITSAGAAKLLLGGPRDELTSRVAAIFGDRDSAEAVGKVYLAAHRSEDDELELVKALQASNAGWRRVSDEKEGRAVAAAQVRGDYESGSMVSVEGWLLSTTEARLCALTTFA